MGLKNTEKERTIYAKLYSKEPGTDTVNAFIGVSKKEGDSWVVSEKFDTLEGRIVGVSRGQFVYKDEEKQVMKFILRDDDGTRYQLEASFTMTAYSLLNCLASVDFSQPVRIVVFTGTNKSTGDPSPVVLVYQGAGKDTRLNWTYSWGDEIPKPTKVKVGKKEVRDDSATVEFFCDVLDALSERCKKEAPEDEGFESDGQDSDSDYQEPQTQEPLKNKKSSGPRAGDMSKEDKIHEQFSSKIQPNEEPSNEFSDVDDDLPF